MYPCREAGVSGVLTLAPNSTKLARFCRALATNLSVRDAISVGVSEQKQKKPLDVAVVSDDFPTNLLFITGLPPPGDEKLDMIPTRYMYLTIIHTLDFKCRLWRMPTS